MYGYTYYYGVPKVSVELILTWIFSFDLNNPKRRQFFH